MVASMNKRRRSRHTTTTRKASRRRPCRGGVRWRGCVGLGCKKNGGDAVNAAAHRRQPKPSPPPPPFSPPPSDPWLDPLRAVFAPPQFTVSGPDSRRPVYQVVQQIDGQSSCLELLFRSSTEEGLTIHVGLLQRCGPLSGRALLALLDRLAVHVGAHQIELDDASFIVVGPVPAGDIWGECDIDYAIFTILATGESFYNQHGYQSEYDGAERARNAALIARPFGETLKSLYAREFAPLPPAQAAALPPSPREDQIAAVVMRDTSLPAYFCERNSALCHLDYTMSTKEIFGAIRASGILRTLKDCADPVAVWLDCVIHLFLPAVVYYGKRLVKTFAVSGGMGAATKRRRSNGRRRG